MIVALINKEVLPYICTKKQVTLEYLHNSTHFTLEQLNKWLDTTDTSLPTIPQAKKLAKCLHIPFAGLYMNKEDIRTNTIPRIKNYRSFDSSLIIDDSCFNIAICDVLQERDFFINQSAELGIPFPSFSVPVISAALPATWATIIRNHYAISLNDQYKCTSPRKLYLYLREKIEQKGVFVQCFTDVPLETARGFSIYEHVLPIIGINDEDRSPAKSFSLIHELVHLIKRESSVCNDMFNTTQSQKEEIFCNAVAGELLVPKDALEIYLNRSNYNSPYSIDTIANIAKKYSVSREVIVRRLLDCEKIKKDEYVAFTDFFRKEIERDREKRKIDRQTGIKNDYFHNISREAIDRTSPSVCKTLYYGFSEELYSKRDIAQHLGIAQKHVDAFLMEVSRWNN